MLTHFPIKPLLAEQRDQGRYRELTCVETGVTPTIQVDGKTYVNFASNDYLGLATEPALSQALIQASQQHPQIGSGASHLITGHSIYHDQLANTLAQAAGYDKALTFSTGYMANVAILQALCSKDTVIFSDKLNHASIVDGTILSRAKVVRFAHRDYTSLEKRLQHTTNAQKLIITDHIFSMDGTIADLRQLAQLAKYYEAALVIDDAHGFGLPYQAYKDDPLLPKADIYMGTLGKAIGTSGAFVAGSPTLIEYLINTARPYIYTTAMPPILARVTTAAFNLAMTDTNRSQQLINNIRQLSEGLSAQGWQVGIDDEPIKTAIIPVMIGDNAQAVALAAQLKAQGFWVSAIRPPTVPVGTARLRFCVSSVHTPQQIGALLAVMQNLIV